MLNFPFFTCLVLSCIPSTATAFLANASSTWFVFISIPTWASAFYTGRIDSSMWSLGICHNDSSMRNTHWLHHWLGRHHLRHRLRSIKTRLRNSSRMSESWLGHRHWLLHSHWYTWRHHSHGLLHHHWLWLTIWNTWWCHHWLLHHWLPIIRLSWRSIVWLSWRWIAAALHLIYDYFIKI